jgi:nucleoid-associated protein YgaU
MDQRVRVAMALAVLLGGVSLALVFRRPGRMGEAPLPSSGEQLMLRKRDALPGTPAAGDRSLARPAAPQGYPAAAPATLEPSRMPAVLKPPETDALPPDSARLHPAGDPATSSRWGVSLGMMLPENGQAAAAETHKIADGDTLPALAERYLGSANRAMEIFEANRGVLASPQLLPIGVELKLPPRQVLDRASPAQAPERPLVPVAP